MFASIGTNTFTISRLRRIPSARLASSPTWISTPFREAPSPTPARRFDGYAGRHVLEVGCGAGTDLARFAKGGAIVSGVDLSSSAIALAKTNFEQQGLQGDLREADGERLPFANDAFDLVYAHGVVQYTRTRRSWSMNAAGC
jgi:SAM-dependent methyltransferase